jgi:hypothetical protein
MEYENVTQGVLFIMESILQNIFVFHKQFYFIVSGLKIIGWGNPDNNLDSLCIFFLKHLDSNCSARFASNNL